MILILGDIHGNFDYLKYKIDHNKITDCYIIQVGDFGIGFTSQENDNRLLENLNDFLRDRNIILYAIRGNHDNPDFFQGNHFYSNLHLVPDYTVLKLDNRNVLCIGGAISIDRIPRIQEDMSAARYGSDRRNYWHDEKIVTNFDFVKKVRDIDTLVTHTAMDFCLPNNKLGFGSLVEDFANYDKNLKDDLKEERSLMTKIWDELCDNNKVTHHFYGHFHRSHVERIVDCDHRLLNINELFEFRF